MTELASLISLITNLQDILTVPGRDKEGLIRPVLDDNTAFFRRDILISELQQVRESKTLARAKYYLRRLARSIQDSRTNGINNINLRRWKEYDDIITDSLWVMGKRDTSGVHLGWYWGNFIPQIPHQMLLRYTSRSDWVLDAFVGSGTTLIECRRLGRNGLGIELNNKVAQRARDLIEQEPNGDNVVTDVFTGDSRTINLDAILQKYSLRQVQLLIMHPPYHDIIKFSDDKRDLSQSASVAVFLRMFGEVVDNFTPYLEKGRYFALVIGDKYLRGEWIPIGFYCLGEVLKRNEYALTGIVVKNFDETRAKRNQENLWRYRALTGGFYLFKHEYIMVFKKKAEKANKHRDPVSGRQS